ncbi:microtubule binding protein [Flagelloscypha sp. PMI_526]|nr:microtubule binding protein [Flagelloscypha sp. PMI_526]
MSRFVRASKYRHVFGQTGKKEANIENIKVTNSAWDTNIVSASGSYIAVNWNASGGGAFAILPLPTPFAPSFQNKLPDIPPLARGHTASVLDTAWSPFDDRIVASGGDDGKIILWKVEDPTVFDNWGAEGWTPTDFDPLLRIDGSARKVGQVDFHPTANNVIAAASGDHLIKLWDLAQPEAPRNTLTGHTDTIQSIAFNRTGSLLATTARDRKIRLFDPRASKEAIRTADSHSGIKGSRVTWCGDLDILATTGFSKMSERQVALWDAKSLDNIKMSPIDQSSGVIMPFWSDNGILFWLGRGIDGNIRYYELESNQLVSLAEYGSTVPQRGMCFLPRKALNVSECEIARAYKVHGSTVEPIAFIVPRKADSFQSDLYPPVPSSEPSLSANEYFDGKPIVAKMVDLQTGGVASTVTASAATPTPATAPTPSPVVTSPAPTPTPAPAPVKQASLPPPEPVRQVQPEPVASPSPPSSSSNEEVESLKAQLEAKDQELREARAKVRELELQVEAVKANARKAAEAFAGLGM